MTLTPKEKHDLYGTILTTLAYTADNIGHCQGYISSLMNDAHEEETADILLIMTDVLQALNLSLAWTDGAADRVGVLRKLFKPVFASITPEGKVLTITPPEFPVSADIGVPF